MFSIGIDTVEIARFNKWTHYSKERLSKIFSEEEIAYCLSEPAKSAERMAARFAAKEAFYKAISSQLKHPFTRVSKLCKIIKRANGNPELEVDWQKLGLSRQTIEISITHTTNLATAIVLLTKSAP